MKRTLVHSLMGSGEPVGRSADGATASTDLPTGSVSPVSELSSTSSSALRISRQSAGTRSPVRTKTTSPGTRSRAPMSAEAPSRTTWHCGGTSVFSMAMDCSLLRSVCVRACEWRAAGCCCGGGGRTLDEGHGAHDEDGHGDGRGVVPLPQAARQEGAPEQQQHERLLELLEELLPRRVGLVHVELVRPVHLRPPRHLGAAEPVLRVALEQAHHRVHALQRDVAADVVRGVGHGGGRRAGGDARGGGGGRGGKGGRGGVRS